MHRQRNFWLALVLVGALLFFLAPSSVLAQGDGETEHIVQPGENLYGIAQHYGVTVRAIVELNAIENPNLIFVGQKLKIPAATITPTATGSATAEATATLAPTATSTPQVFEEVIHVVKVSDNLYRIAVQYNSTVRAISELNGITNPNLIFIGQELRIPVDAAGTPTATPAATTEGTLEATVEGTVETTVEATTEVTAEVTVEVTTEVTVEVTVEATIAPATDIPTAEVLPTEPPTATTTPVPVSTDAPTPTPSIDTTTPVPVNTDVPVATESAPTDLPSAGVAFDYGVQANLFVPDKQAVVDRLKALGVKWVKVQVEWQYLQPTPDEIVLDELDAIVSLLNGAEMNIMLTVTNAPAWARNGLSEENGPPVNYQDYANFVGTLAERYKGVVKAYEIWNEPNVKSQWNGKPLSASEYVTMLGLAYSAIKVKDLDAIVLTAGLRPTSGNDGVNVIDDRTYLRQMYEAGVGTVADAIGAHPHGFGNPPDSTCCDNNPEILGWDDQPNFFFLDTLVDYRAIMNSFGDSGKFIWATEFGWGSSEGFGGHTPPEGLGFVGFTSLDEQADYTVRAFQKGRELGYVGPMFAWNLNECQILGTVGIGTPICYWGMLNPVGDPRPIFNVLANTSKE